MYPTMKIHVINLNFVDFHLRKSWQLLQKSTVQDGSGTFSQLQVELQSNNNETQ